MAVEVSAISTPSCTFLSTDFGWSIFSRDSYALRINHAVSSACQSLRDHARHTTEALCTWLRDLARLLNLIPGKHGYLNADHVDQLLSCMLPLMESETTSDCLLEQLCKVILCKSFVVKAANHVCDWRAITRRWFRMYADGNKVTYAKSSFASLISFVLFRCAVNFQCNLTMWHGICLASSTLCSTMWWRSSGFSSLPIHLWTYTISFNLSHLHTKVTYALISSCKVC